MRGSLLSMLLVALGGAVGSVARYRIAGWLLQGTLNGRLPWPTLAVNLLGCLIIGVLAGLGEKHDLFSQNWRLLLFTGLLGGFTTFSTFGLETIFLLRRQEWLVAFGYVGLSLLGGLLLVWGGFQLVPPRSQ